MSASQPDLAIDLSGVDPHVDDRLGRLALTARGLEKRDRVVLGLLRDCGIPFAVAMDGGCGADIDVTVGIHLATVRVAAELLAGR
jgi:acetoin utilization deacetylase AcuC-like enzyme